MASTDIDARSRALEEIVALARAHQLSGAEIAAAVGDAPATPSDQRAQRVVVRVLGVLGGSFVFAGVCAFIALQWDHMNSASRVIATLGPGVVALVLAVLASREPRFEKATTPLLLVASVPAAHRDARRLRRVWNRRRLALGKSHRVGRHGRAVRLAVRLDAAVYHTADCGVVCGAVLVDNI